MTAFIILSACVGYYFLNRSYKHKYKVARRSGHHLYLHAISLGILFTGIAFVIKELLVMAMVPLLSKGFVFSEQQLAAMIVFIAFGTAHYAISYSNRRHDAYKAYTNAMQTSDDLNSTLFRAMDKELQIQVTLETRKVYVGFVIDSLEPMEDDAYISILPSWSGYRTDDKLQIQFTNNYRSVFEILQENPELLWQYGIIVPKKSIVTCHVFNMDLHRKILFENKSREFHEL